MAAAISIERGDALRLLRLDADRLNLLTPDVVAALHAALCDAESDPEVQAVVLLGRPGAFSAGLDLSVLAGDADAARQLFGTMGRLLHALYGSRLRVVAGCTGHAVAAGAMLLLVSDLRIAADGPFRIGFSEVGRGMPLPELPVMLARDRLDRRRLQEATLLGRLFAPTEAAEVGFVDRVVSADDVEEQALEAARALAKLPADAYTETLGNVRGGTLARFEALLARR